ncbi:hypothetical protein [Pseudoclavibacter sp. CFCC 13611]|uniref:hypothetical protein n=1 Tax=Pseudoclavibacter sp. CFCC 13611 TaxID=2615178 RepID=UPI001787CFF1|nr:hypothetical protein [Pseudoclavibacter sp. CFCC 13611]
MSAISASVRQTMTRPILAKRGSRAATADRVGCEAGRRTADTDVVWECDATTRGA